MSARNSRNNRPLNPDDLIGLRTNARSSFQNYKESAASAAANAYMLFRDTQSDYATKEGKDWIENEIKVRNEEITEHNDKLKEDQKRVTDYKENKLPDTDFIFNDPKNAEEKKQIAAEKQRLDSLKAKDKAYWDRERLVKIEAKEGASQFTKIVKYTFEFDRAIHSTSVYRFTTALEWVHEKLSGEEINDVAEIVTAIDAAGGFEAILEEMRLKRSGDDSDQEDRKIIADRIYSDTKAALKEAKPLATIPLEARHSQDGLVLMVAKYEGGKAQVVAEIEAGDGEFKRLISRYEDPNLLPVAPTTEFVGRLLALGELVSEGENSSGNNKKDDDATKTQRLLILHKGKNGKLEFMISARFADAAVIVKAQPKSEIELGSPDAAIFMKSKTRRELEKKISTYERRRLIDMSSDMNPLRADGKAAEASMSWIACNSALKEKNSKNASGQFYWYNLDGQDKKPLDTDHFEPRAFFSLSGEHIRSIYNEGLNPWEKLTDARKASKLVTIKNDADTIHVTVKDEKTVSVPVLKATGPTVAASFRPRELSNLFSLLTKQHGAEYAFALDEAGLLEVRWEDALSSYQVYLPTATSDARLQSRRVAPMRIDLPLAAE